MKFLNLLVKLYLSIFARYQFRFFNIILFKLIIKSLGYNNYGNYSFTGELNLINIINKFDLRMCLDIGANVGKYSKKLLENTDSNVIAFEPNRYCFKKLLKLEKKYPKKIMCFNIAISNKKGKKYLYYGDKRSELASMHRNANKLNFILNKNKNKMKIDCISLDEFCIKKKIKKIDFIKIDTEGHEQDVLIGSKKSIKKYNPKFIQIEFNTHQLLNGNTLLNYKSYLKNYKVYRLLPFGKKLLPIDIYKPENNIFHLANIVFVRKDINYEKN